MKLSRTLLAGAVACILGVVAISCGSSGDGAGAGGRDAGADVVGDHVLGFGDGSNSGDTGMGVPCEETCPTGLVCVQGMCEPPQPQCFTNANCQYDTYCKSGQCVPFCVGSDECSDPNCKLAVAPGVLAPKIFCEFSTPPAGDPFPNHVDVQATPVVVNFNPKGGGTPSIVVPFTQPVAAGYTEVLGVMRILSGKDCSLQANLGGVDLDGDSTVDWVNSPSAAAVGDLDGDGVAEIVAMMGDRTTVAFTLKNGAWKPLWPKVKATLADGTTLFVCLDDGVGRNAPGSGTSLGVWSSLSIHDLDNDGFPEVIREAYVIDGRTGKVRASLPANYVSYSVGMPPVLYALGGSAYLTNGAHLWKFDPASSAWVTDAAYDAQTSNPGWAAIADFNPYDTKAMPEIVVASSDTLSVYNLDHTPFMGMSLLAVPGTGGGPPTIADYDGDGLPEVGIAGKDFYTVFNPDCQGTPRPGGMCPTTRSCDTGPGTSGPCPNLILWSKKTQDHSSNITGSSVFDFEASGIAKVVYADECFARVYDGRNGTVLFSQTHSSCTWIENPVVADVDGDFRAELVVPSNTACGPIGTGIDCSGSVDSSGVDSSYAGLICQQNSDCFSNSCVAGLCRCTDGGQCCAAGNAAACLTAGYACVPPPAGTAGTGNTCRAARGTTGVQGIRVYKDAKDRWVRSRTIWNQHAYAVTNVNDDGTVPKTSQWALNWTTTGLNNFRQNVPGTADGTTIGDVTAQAGPFFTCNGSEAVLNAPVCNRGTAPIGAGIPVGFYVAMTKVCSATTPGPIDIGKCVNVSCTWMSPPTTQATEVNVTVVPNDGHAIQECDTSNDDGLVEDVFCMPPH